MRPEYKKDIARFVNHTKTLGEDRYHFYSEQGEIDLTQKLEEVFNDTIGNLILSGMDGNRLNFTKEQREEIKDNICLELLKEAGIVTDKEIEEIKRETLNQTERFFNDNKKNINDLNVIK